MILDKIIIHQFSVVTVLWAFFFSQQRFLLEMGKKQAKSFYFTCLIIFREVQLAASSFLVLNPYLHLGIEVWYFKSLVYRYIAPYIVHILSSLSTFV